MQKKMTSHKFNKTMCSSDLSLQFVDLFFSYSLGLQLWTFLVPVNINHYTVNYSNNRQHLGTSKPENFERCSSKLLMLKGS